MASVAAALASSIGARVAARAAQGASAALVLPLTLTMISEAFPPESRGRAIGIWGGVTGLGGVLGPILGAAMVQVFGWSWIFWINVPIAIALIPAALRFVTKTYGARQPLDLAGVVLASVGFLGISWALVQASSHSFGSATVVVPAAAGFGLVACFVGSGAKDSTPDTSARDLPERSVQRRQRGRLLHLRHLCGAFLTSQYFQVAQHLARWPPRCGSCHGRCRRVSLPRWSDHSPRSTAISASWLRVWRSRPCHWSGSPYVVHVHIRTSNCWRR